MDLTLVATMVIALLCSVFIGHYADPIGRRLSLMDWPDTLGGRKQHLSPTPLVGGAAVCLAATVAALFSAYSPVSAAGAAVDDLRWFVFAVTAMFAIGVTDDRHALSPRTRLGASMIIIMVVLSGAPAFELANLVFQNGFVIPLGHMGMLFTLVCLVGLLNAVNMADGKNGLVVSLGLIWCAVLAAHAPVLWMPTLAALTVSLSVMFWFNMRGKLFLGDGGSYGLSSIFGLMAIHLHVSDPSGISADQVALMFIVPTLDTIRLVSIRIVRGASPFSGDRDHLHHHLARRWGWPTGLYVYCALVGIPNLLAVFYPPLSAYAVAGSVLAYILVMSTSHVPEEVNIMPGPTNVSQFPKKAPGATGGAAIKAVRPDEDAA